MGLLKTQKLDNGNISFECVYGGLEAPFGGIDASKAPRYIDPKCFADASNFLVVDNELCVCNLFPITFPDNGVSYPINVGTFGQTIEAARLIGVGTLPCENIVKNWALFTSTVADSDNLWHYRLILWTFDTVTIESYDFAIVGQQIIAPAQNAKATVTVSWAYPFTGVQSMPFGHTPDPYDHLWYEMFGWKPSVSGVPTGGLTACEYKPVFDYHLMAGTVVSTGAIIFGNTPAGGPVSPPTLTAITDQLFDAMTYTSLVPSDLPFTTGARLGTTTFELVARTMTPGVGGCSSFPSVDGAAGNSIRLSGGTFSYQYGYYPVGTGNPFVSQNDGNPPPPQSSPFAQPSVVVTVTPFSGGTDAGQLIYSNIPIEQLTWETVGDSLFLAGWPAGYMLQFNNTSKQLTYLTQYQGARVLKKMAGHLISVGLIESAQQPVVSNSQLWFSWSAPNGAYGIWEALNLTTGLETGAGGEQLADISDQLTGLVVSNSVAFILRGEGLSYASVTGSSALPFDVNHVDLCKIGQGCGSTSLWTQYDQVGFYVGNSNVFILQQGPQAIGDKILEALFPTLIERSNAFTQFTDFLYNTVNVEPLSLVIDNRPVVFFAVNINGIIYVYNPQDDTWMKIFSSTAFPFVGHPFTNDILKVIALPANGVTGYVGSYQYKGSFLYLQQTWDVGLTNFELQAPLMFQFLPNISEFQDSFVLFPSEEISHGRDITIDAIYATLSGLPGVVVTMTVSGWQGDPSVYITDAFMSTVTLDANAIPTESEEYQFFNSDGSAITLKAPQLKLLISGQTVPAFTPPPGYKNYPVNSNPDFKASKISMFGSFDPNQRPV